MSIRFNIDSQAYESMLERLNSLSTSDTLGQIKDVAFIRDDFWLQDTAVVENICIKKGLWNIYLVFAMHNRPLRFLVREIASCNCIAKATLMAHYMRRLAAKDQRGTLVINQVHLNLTYN